MAKLPHKFYLFIEEDKKVACLIHEVFRILGSRSFWEANRTPQTLFLRMWDVLQGLFQIRAERSDITNVMNAAREVIARCRGGAYNEALDQLASKTSEYTPVIESLHWAVQVALEALANELEQIEVECDYTNQANIISAIRDCWYAVSTKKKEAIMEKIDKLHSFFKEGEFYYNKTSLSNTKETSWQLFV